jgi:hypothetical protein
MYVQFEYTREDLVDASKRLLYRKNPERSKVWKSSLLSAISVAVIIVFLFRNNPRIGLLLGLVVAGIIVLYPQLEKSGLEGRLRRGVVEMMPDHGPAFWRLCWNAFPLGSLLLGDPRNQFAYTSFACCCSSNARASGSWHLDGIARFLLTANVRLCPSLTVFYFGLLIVIVVTLGVLAGRGTSAFAKSGHLEATINPTKPSS